MKKHILIAIISVLLPAVMLAQTWKNDPPHSRMEFTISHNMISDLGGVFNDFTITAQAAETDFSDATFDVNIQMKSIDTQVEQRDEHLRSPDFFDVDKFPEMQFKTQQVRQIDKNTFLVTGELTLHGISKTVDLTMVHNGSFTKDDKTTSGITVTGSILRSDFDIGTKFPIAVVGDKVTLRISAEMKKQ